MNGVALRRRMAALVMAAILALSGAAVSAAAFADDAHAVGIQGHGNTGN